MKHNPYLANIILAAELTVIFLAYLLIRAFTPAAVFPRITVPSLVLLSAGSLAAEHYLSPSPPRHNIISTALAGLSFALLPCAAGFGTDLSPWMLFSVSAAVFGITEMLYIPIARRSRGPLSPAVNALCLYLASQCFQGLI